LPRSEAPIDADEAQAIPLQIEEETPTEFSLPAPEETESAFDLREETPESRPDVRLEEFALPDSGQITPTSLEETLNYLEVEEPAEGEESTDLLGETVHSGQLEAESSADRTDWNEPEQLTVPVSTDIVDQEEITPDKFTEELPPAPSQDTPQETPLLMQPGIPDQAGRVATEELSEPTEISDGAIIGIPAEVLPEGSTGITAAPEILPGRSTTVDGQEHRIVSRTLAEIYASQGAFEEAILTYQLLKRSKPGERGAIDQRIGELALQLRDKLTQ
jgi:hypothetical protein